jgi:hemerythrin-like domain-containing protein
MPDKSSSAKFAQDLLRIHRVISRGLFVSVTKGVDFVLAGFPDPGLRQGYVAYTQSLATVLDAHHLGEDEIVFPSLREKITAAPYERLTRHHQEIVVLLNSAGKAIKLVAEKGDQADLAELVRLLRKVADIWRPHIQAEEFYFSEEALAAAVSPEEQERLSTALAKHSQEHAVPPTLALPFVLFNLEAEDRAAMAASLPVMVVQELIPKGWKAQWAPMKPFLLE